MIDGETGERTIHTLVKSQDEVRYTTKGNIYQFSFLKTQIANIFNPKND